MAVVLGEGTRELLFSRVGVDTLGLERTALLLRMGWVGVVLETCWRGVRRGGGIWALSSCGGGGGGISVLSSGSASLKSES